MEKGTKADNWKDYIREEAAKVPLAVVGIGLPGSGKTTVPKPLASEINAVYVNRDDIRFELTGDITDHSRESAVNAEVNKLIVRATKERSHVIIDATHNGHRGRREVTYFLRRCGVKRIIGLYINMDLATSLSRNSSRERKVPEETIKTMHDRLTRSVPRQDEGFDLILTIHT